NASKNGYPKSVAVLGASPAGGNTAITPTPDSSAKPSTTAHSTSINNYTNNDWLNGVWRKSAGFSIPLNNANRSAFKAGSQVKLVDGQVRKINAVYMAGNNISVMLSGAAL